MADKQISQLTAATTVNDDDLLVLQQGATAKKLSGKKLGDYVYAAAAEKIDEVNEAVAEAQIAVAGLIEDKDEIVAVIASMAELGTDTTLTQTGMAADSKTVGDKMTLLAGNITGVLSSRTATTNIPKGKLVIFNYNLYKTTVAIASGELLTPGTNCTATTLAAELEAIETSLETKAEINGTYEAMTVGNAEQIVATEGVEENTPYVFRKSGGGGIAIGNREADTLIGGTIAWNQLVQNGNFASTSNWVDDFSTISVSNNVLSMSPSQTGRTTFGLRTINNLALSAQFVGHKYLAHISVKSDVACTIQFQVYGLNIFYAPIEANVWTEIPVILTISSTISNYTMRVYAVTGSSATFETSTVVQIKNATVYDLTKMFGKTIADYIYSLEQAHAGDGVAWFKNLFPNDYYAYNAGELMSVNTSAHVTSGKNLIGEENLGIAANTWLIWGGTSTSDPKADGSFVLLKGEYVFSASVPIDFWIEDENGELVTYENTGYTSKIFNNPKTQALKISIRRHDLAVPTISNTSLQFEFGSTATAYEPYISHTYPLDSELTIRGLPKLDDNNNLYYDGDVYEVDGTVTRKYGIVDLGTLNWEERVDGTYRADIVGNKIVSSTTMPNIICQIYRTDIYANVYAGTNDKTISTASSGNKVYVCDSAYTDATAFKTAMSGVYLVYELATPTTETADPYAANQVVSGDGTEEYVDAGVQAGTRDVSVPVGHNTIYQQDLRTKLQDAPDSPSEDGDYIMRRTNGHNTYAKGNFAETNGDYPNMTVGNAEQLVSTIGIEDKTPYNFRTSGGSVDIGDRETDKLIGGTIAWNQLVRNGNFVDGTYWGNSNASKSVANNVISFTPSAQYGNVYQVLANYPYKVGHKYLLSVDVKAASNHTVSIGVGDNVTFTYGTPTAVTTEWKNFTHIYAITVVSNNASHNVFARDDGTSGYVQIDLRNYTLFDLTQMFGATIADYVYSLEQTTAGAGVAWFKALFPKPYYEYNAGELLSVNTSAHNMTGFNQWDEQWELGEWSTSTGTKTDRTDRICSKNYIPVIPSTKYYINAGYASSCCYDANKNFIGSTPWSYTTLPGQYFLNIPSNAHYIHFTMPASYGTTYKNDICINISWDGERDGEYEPYVEYNYPLDSSLELRGVPRLDSANNLYYDGDTYESDSTVTRRYGIITLQGGSEATYNYNGATSVTLNAIVTISGKANGRMNFFTDKFTVMGLGESAAPYKTSGRDNSSFVEFLLPPSVEQSVSAVKAWFASNPTTVVYELAESTTETAEPYQNPQIVDDFGTEEYVDYAESQGTRDVKVPVGHETVYAPNLRAKLETAPDSPPADGDYIVRQTNGENQYVQLVIPQELPNTPGTDGTYRLQAVVSGGTATLSWVSAT